MLRVAGQPGVMHPAHGGMVLQPLRQGQRLVRLGAHAQVQGFQALEHHPSVERRQRHTAAFEHRQKLLDDHGLAGAQGTRHDAALAVQVLGARVHDDVSPEQHRALQRRRGKAVVQRQQGAGVVGNIGQSLDVTHLGERVGGCLGKQQPGVAAHRGLPGGSVGLRHKGGFHAKAGQVGANEPDGGAKHRARAHDVITRLEQGQTHHQNGGHARGGANGGLGAL